jgi:ATP-dependent Clp protease ATP-binding subunit ClpX
VKIDTSNILFICGGAFEGIEKIIARRINKQQVGFKKDSSRILEAEKDHLLKNISPSDLRAYGLIPEIIGRLPILTTMESLDKVTLRSILTEPKNALIKQYVRLFELDGIKLTVEPEVIDFIVDQAFAYKLGARGLRSICEVIMMDYMYAAPGMKKKSLSISFQDAQEQWKKHRNATMAA